MLFARLSIARKLWLLVISLLGVMLLLSTVLIQYRAYIDEKTTEQINAAERRIGVAMKWHGLTELGVERAIIGAIVTDEDVSKRLLEARKAASAMVTDIQKQINEEAMLAQDKEQLDRIGEARKVVLELVGQAQQLRSAGDIDSAKKLVDSKLRPAADTYLAQQDKYIDMQKERLVALGVSKQEQLNIALGIGSVVALLVIATGLYLSSRIVGSVVQPLDEAVALAQAIAKGDLSMRIQVNQRQDELGRLLQALSMMSDRLRQLVSDVRAGVGSISTASSEIALGNQDLSQRTEQTASSLQETSSRMEQLTNSVTQAADTANQANQLASSAATAATHGGQVVDQVVDSMQKITDSSRKISDIISVIDGIAFQTNILALNAAVEAARAGEQGRGFAVVATEVRSLAGRSADAAKEIKSLITASVESVEAGSGLVEEAGRSMGEIVSSVRRVSDLVAEISSSAMEQREGIAKVSSATNQLDQMTQQNAALVEQSAAAASSLRDQAQRLNEVVSVFKVGDLALQPASMVVSKPLVKSALPTSVTPAAKLASPVVKPALARPVVVKALSRSDSTVSSAAKATTADDDWETF
ncbi:HAMP domain-containing protein [Curvibacter sp. CHRR-16]|uniref:methyl-accepting chemotaxis protein n=1 Tax=Curvibacter sp. CHRR-16 TaxID=2835872 RepID=UPI001BD918EA|nr:methyl-accepting chemotaxis protein [Curvibacter sp. CHRR-16]MBT0570892.1 HAMP domain-containing protein [Curvibacter sp. CHRR-16]